MAKVRGKITDKSDLKKLLEEIKEDVKRILETINPKKTDDKPKEPNK